MSVFYHICVVEEEKECTGESTRFDFIDKGLESVLLRNDTDEDTRLTIRTRYLVSLD